MGFQSFQKVVLCTAFFMGIISESLTQEADVKKFVDGKKNFRQSEAGWYKGGFLNTNFTNVGLSNWAAGGQSSVSVALIGNSFLIYKDSNQIWESYMDAAWGNIRNGRSKLPDGTPNSFFKNEDKLIILSKYGRKINNKWNYTALAEFKSQFLPGFAPFDPSSGSTGPHVSNFLAPAFGLTSIGFDYKPNTFLSFYISPITGKFTIVNEERLSDLGAFGVRPALTDVNGNTIKGSGQRFRSELGWYINFMFNKEVMQNVTLRSRVDMFTNFKTPALIDINWETTINMKVNKYITSSIFTHLIYDDDIDVRPEIPYKSPGIQFKHVLGIGLSFKFGDKL
jgi:hypothetical protein